MEVRVLDDAFCGSQPQCFTTDLASTDEEIAAALARDATTMLEPEPEAFQAWLRRWLDPRGGEPGWQWLVAGAPERITRRLARIAPLEDAG